MGEEYQIPDPFLQTDNSQERGSGTLSIGFSRNAMDASWKMTEKGCRSESEQALTDLGNKPPGQELAYKDDRNLLR